MKVMACADVRIGEPTLLNMAPERFMAWQRDKVRAFAGALASARELGAQACLVAGGLFAEGFVPQSLLVGAAHAMESCGMTVTYVMAADEARGFEGRVSLPGGVECSRGMPTDLWNGMGVGRNGGGGFVSYTTSDGKVTQSLGALEPSSFEAAGQSGFWLFDVEDGRVVSRQFVEHAMHPFVVRAANIDGCQSSKEMADRVAVAIAGANEDACLRLELKGSVPFGTHFDTHKLSEVLNRRFFYAEVANEALVAVEPEELEGDISLMAEFVRLVTADGSLSPVEKSRILACGWSAMNGKELAQ